MEKVKEAKATETKKSVTPKNGTPKVEPKQADQEAQTPKAKMEIVKNASATVEQILNPTAEGRISKLETFNILAEKQKTIKSKYDDLTNFLAGNDQTATRMDFVAQNGYKFGISNERVINKVLLVIEAETADLLEKANAEVLKFNI
tara:strand:- start:230 stop:667 length:438 start_codon:yes stop_codon:yes gene_type:complete